ncbi:MAG: aminotransferase class V-fold PLP-dependent enzyme [Leucobacter sp.]
MSLPHSDIDPNGLLEYSVVFTDRSLNHMSARFVSIMQETLAILREAYNANTAVIVPGGGTYAMEAVARQLATDKRALIVRNGLFSFRWSQIIEVGRITDEVTVCKARPVTHDHQAVWEPAPIDEVTAAIKEHRPEVVFAPHVETASGMILPDDYLRELADAAHAVGALFVLDCIASGTIWVDMEAVGVDVLISAPQKGWSGSPGAGFVMLSERAREAVSTSTTSSFAIDLLKWMTISDGYVQGAAGYHATMPTDTIAHNLEVMRETRDRGWEQTRTAQHELGARVRKVLAARGLPPVATGEFAAPGVVVAFTDDPELQNGARFKSAGLQIAAGVPLQCGEPKTFATFRMGLFGLDKLGDVDGTVARLEKALDEIGIRP